MAESTSRKREYKVVLIGDLNVGKTSIFKRFRENVFHERVNSTIGLDFYKKDVDSQEGPVKISLWDTAGMERAGSLTSSHYSGAHAVLLVFSAEDPLSLEHVEKWMENAKRYTKNAEKCLVGNKYDLDKYMIEVKDSSIEETIKRMFIDEGVVFKVSAKTGEGIDAMFSKIADFLNQGGYCTFEREYQDPFVILGQDETDDSAKKCC